MKLFNAGIIALFLTLTFGYSTAIAQKTAPLVVSIPETAKEAAGFVPIGWKLSENGETTGDLNGDNIPDHVFAIQENKGEKALEDGAEEAQILIVAFGSENGRLKKAATASMLLPCTKCYGMVGEDFIGVEKGVLTYEHSAGSGNNLSKATYRFRYNATTKKFALIGTEFLQVCPQRDEVRDIIESNNLITGARKTTRPVGKRDVTKAGTTPKTKSDLESLNAEEFETPGFERVKCK